MDYYGNHLPPVATIEEERATEPETPEPDRVGRPRGRVFIVTMVAALVGGAMGTGATLALTDDRSKEPTTIVERVAQPSSEVAGSVGGGVAGVAKKLMPSIVRIDVTAQGRTSSVRRGTGSGVIFTTDGYILTNNHVVGDAASIEVTLADGEKLAARLVGSASPVDDIAVIKVEKTGLTPATLGSTSDLSVGDLAVAVGSPFGLQGTVTAGVISALHRSIDLGGGERLTDALQTDAPINPGNSGGALANARGEVIGINTAIVGSTNSSAGVGFAIPIDIARRHAERIIQTGTSTRPFLGISGESVPGGGGAVIQELIAGGPAEKAGLRAGDVIVAINRAEIDSMEDLISTLTNFNPGDKVVVTYLRKGTRENADVVLGSVRPEQLRLEQTDRFERQ